MSILMISNMKADVDKKIVFGIFNPDKLISISAADKISPLVSSQFEVSPSGGYMGNDFKIVTRNFKDYYMNFISGLSYSRYNYGIREGNGENVIICYVSCYGDELIKQRSIGFCWEGDSLIGIIDTYFDPPGLVLQSTGKTIMEIVSDSITRLHIPEKCLIDKTALKDSSHNKYCYITVTIPESGIRVVKISRSKDEFNANLKKSVRRRLKGNIMIDEELVDKTFYEASTGCDMSQEIVLRDELNHYVLVTLYYNGNSIMYAEIDYLDIDK